MMYKHSLALYMAVAGYPLEDLAARGIYIIENPVKLPDMDKIRESFTALAMPRHSFYDSDARTFGQSAECQRLHRKNKRKR